MLKNQYNKAERKKEVIVTKGTKPPYNFPLVESPTPTRLMTFLNHHNEFKKIVRINNYTKKFTGNNSVVIGYEYVGDNWVSLLDHINGEIPNKKEQYLLIDDTYEGLLDQEKIDIIKNLVTDQFKDVLIVTSNHKLQDEKVVIFNIHLFSNNYDNINVKNTPLQLNNNLRSKKYLCLNRQERVHRLKTIEFLQNKNLLDCGHVSCGVGDYKYVLQAGLDQGKIRREIELRPYIDQQFLDFTLPYKTKKNLVNVLPLNLDLDDTLRNRTYKNLPNIQHYYDDSYFSIVTERDFFTDKYYGFTEKVMKCFLYGHPFIVIGLPYTLDILKDYGFLSFNGFIDESYDRIQDHNLRFNAATFEVEKLCNLNQNQLHFMYEDMQPILEHNFNNYQKIIKEVHPKEIIKVLAKWFGDDFLTEKEYLNF